MCYGMCAILLCNRVSDGIPDDVCLLSLSLSRPISQTINIVLYIVSMPYDKTRVYSCTLTSMIIYLTVQSCVDLFLKVNGYI